MADTIGAEPDLLIELATRLQSIAARLNELQVVIGDSGSFGDALASRAWSDFIASTDTARRELANGVGVATTAVHQAAERFAAVDEQLAGHLQGFVSDTSSA